jgi:hypothetical protein
MIPALYSSQETGLNGKFGAWLKKKIQKVIKIVESIPVVGPIIADVLDEGLKLLTNDYGGDNPDSWWNPPAARELPSYEPTISEQQLLDAWADGRLEPFYKRLAEEVSAALRLSDFSQQVRGINAALGKMCVARYHFTYNETAGLSPNAVSLRMQLLDEIFAPIEQLIAESLDASNLVLAQVSVRPVFSDYAPLISSSSTAAFSCDNYIGGDTAQNQSFLPAGTTIMQLLPDKIVKPVNPVVKVPTVTGNTPQPSDKKDNTGVLVGVAMGIAALILLLSGGGKKKKSES